MVGKVELIINHIDENYHDILEKEKIEELTNVSLGHFRNEFKEIVGISLDKYRIRRELTLIIDEIDRSKAKINESNLLPWSDENGFYSAFKKEFCLSPKQYLLGNKETTVLQERFNIKSYSNDKKLISTLKKEHGSYENALIYLLSLPVYKREGFSAFVLYKDDEEFYMDLIRDYYGAISGKRYSLGEVPKEYYKNHVKQLRKYYDKEKCIQFDTFENGINSEENRKEEKFFIGGARKVFVNPIYIVVKRNLILQLFKLVDIDKFFGLVNVRNLKTIWHAMIVCEKKTIENKMGVMPNELIEQRFLTFEQWDIVHEIVFMENGAIACNDLSEFRDRLKYDYNKPIETEGICDNCKLKKYDEEIQDCIYACDDSCPREAMLTKEEKEIFNKGPEWERLEMNVLKQELVNLMIMGLVYL